MKHASAAAAAAAAAAATSAAGSKGGSSASSSSSTGGGAGAPPLSAAAVAAIARREAAAGPGETLTLQDASGKQVYVGTRQDLESHYVVVLEEPSSSSSGGEGGSAPTTTTYSVLPVSSWYTFVRQAQGGKQLTIAEQQELFEMMQQSGPRASAVRALDRVRELGGQGSSSSSGKFAAEGGAADDGTNLELVDGDGDREGNYRTSYLRSLGSSKSGRGGGGGGGGGNGDGGGFAVEGGDFEAAYDDLDGAAAGGGGGGGEEGAGSKRRRGYFADAEEGGRTREFDVVGGEGDAVEQAADVIHDFFGDDEGDDGQLGADDINFLAGGPGGAGAGGREEDEDGAAILGAASGAAGQDGEDDDDLGVDLEADDVDGDKIASLAAQRAGGGGFGAAAQAQAEAQAAAAKAAAAGKKAAAAAGTDAELRAAKRGRLDDSSMRAELVSFLRAQGGRAPSEAIARNFGRYVSKDPALKRTFFEIINEVTKRETHLDGKLYFVLLK
jgi:hypothetical protein